MKISVICPVKNEVDFIGYSIMAVLPYIHEFVYALGDSDDGTNELLLHIKEKYAKDKLQLLRRSNGPLEQNIYEFDPMDMTAYNRAFNDAIAQATGDAVWFLHPDMIVTNPEALLNVPADALAWFTHVNSYARDFKTEIVAGRTKRWKNIHAMQFGVHYFGGYGSVNEDFYHKDITGTAYRHYGDDFVEYPYDVADSGIYVNHYCELKSYARRLEKMKRCLQTQHPGFSAGRIEELAMQHPRVTLEAGISKFGHFDFAPSTQAVPSVFEKYKDEFESFKKIGVTTNG